jgi:hypothetical protein
MTVYLTEEQTQYVAVQAKRRDLRKAVIIRELIDLGLRYSQTSALEAAAGSLKDDTTVPAEWADPQSTIKWVNDLRAESDREKHNA